MRTRAHERNDIQRTHALLQQHATYKKHTVQPEATGPETNINEYEHNNPRPGSEQVNTSSTVTLTTHRTGIQLNFYFMAAAYE